MTATLPPSPPSLRPSPRPDRTWLLIGYAAITSALMLLLEAQLGALLQSGLLVLFLANLLFAHQWRAAPWAKLTVAVTSLLIVLPLVGRENTGIFDLAINIGIFAALALGLNIVVGLAGLLDLGYVAFFAVGAYVWGIFASPQIGRIFEERSAAFTFSAADGWLLALTLVGLAVFLIRRAATEVPKFVRAVLNLVVTLGFLAGFLLLCSLLFKTLVAAGAIGGELGGGINPNFFWLFLILGIAAAAIVGILIGLPVLKLRGDYLAIVTLGLGEVIRVLATNLSEYTNGSQGITPIGSAPVPILDSLARSLGFTPDQFNLFFLYFLVLLVIALIVVANTRLDQSRVGRAWIAIREDEVAAQAMGVPLVRTKLLAFAAGASFAGIMGVIFAAKQNFISPESFNFFQSIGVLSMVILGGMGSIPGVILGATVVTLLNLNVLPSLSEQLQASLPNLNANLDPAQYQRLVFGVILVLMMLFRPEGLLPSVRRKIEMHEGDDGGGGAVDSLGSDAERRANDGTLTAGRGFSNDSLSPGLATREEDDRTGGEK